MTKLRIMSDLHLEFGPMELTPIGEDILILAGDIGIYTDGAIWAAAYSTTYNIPVVMIAGNHEFYRTTKHRHTIDRTLVALRAVEAPLFHFLENATATILGIRFIGCTLWTDYGNNPIAMYYAEQSMNDHRKIKIKNYRRFTANYAQSMNRESVRFLYDKLNEPCTIPTVTITHHLPSALSLDERYINSPLNPAYASHLDYLVEGALWVHGHTHVSKDYMIGNTRVVCNPRGYAGYELNPDFNPNLIVEV